MVKEGGKKVLLSCKEKGRFLEFSHEKKKRVRLGNYSGREWGSRGGGGGKASILTFGRGRALHRFWGGERRERLAVKGQRGEKPSLHLEKKGRCGVRRLRVRRKKKRILKKGRMLPFMERGIVMRNGGKRRVGFAAKGAA